MTTKSKPKQEFQEQPNPELQAKLTDPEQDRAEQHIVPDSSPSPADLRSAEAPGIRTEPEVVAAHAADNERAAAAAGHTADPADSTSAVKFPRVENRDAVYWFRRKSDGWVDGVNEGTPEHARVLSDPDFEPASRPKADG